ncbi:glycosyltransferase [Planctomycetota bacterium]
MMETLPGSELHLSVVAIGRNEGARLVECLQSLVSQSRCVVYVDSGSTDSSCDEARRLGVDVVDLDMSRPFTAARARNTGFAQVLKLAPQTDACMFVDGDCVISDRFLASASSHLANNRKLAVVVGRLREHFPDASIYNRLCDMEWITPIGEISECGGNALVRTEALKEIGGYREDLIAGEEPEMCIRLANRGWTMECINADMGFHDARMTRFSQWWKRSTRCGHAYAEGAALHGKGPSQHNVKQLRSILFWGIAVPIGSLLCLVLSATISPWFLIGALAWPLGWLFVLFRVFRYRISQGDESRHAWLYAFFCVLAKLPNAIGAIKYYGLRCTGQKSKIIEY